MDDRTMLEMAARAAGYVVVRESDDGNALLLEGVQESWNPLTDDGDALRLSAKLAIDIMHRFVGGQRVEALAPGGRVIVEYCDAETRQSATRTAIVRAAAAIGQEMK